MVTAGKPFRRVVRLLEAHQVIYGRLPRRPRDLDEFVRDILGRK
jgi:hypothetical protein